jgi:outer membrane protein
MTNKHCCTSILSLLCLLLFLQATNATAEEKTMELSLRQALKIALANNLKLQLSKQDLEMARGKADAEYGGFDSLLQAGAVTGESSLTPNMEGGAYEEDISSWNTTISKKLITGTKLGISWNNGRNNNDSNSSLINPLYTSGVDVEISQPLLQGLGSEVQTAGIRAAEKESEAAVFLVHREAAELTSQVRKAYWEMVSARQEIEVLQLSLTLAKQLEKETKSRIEAGLLAEVEIFQPQSEIARREQNLISGERAVGVAEDNLRYLLNNQEWTRTLNPIDRPAIAPSLPVLNTILNNALANRPDIKAADMQTEAAEIATVSLKDRTLPSLDIFGSVGLLGSEDDYGGALERLSNDGKSRWQIGLRFSTPLENRNAKGQYRQAKAILNQAKTQAELLRQQTRILVRQAIRDIKLSLKAIDATRKTTLTSQKRLEGEQTKFEVGQATTCDVLVAQEAFSKTVADEYRAQIIHAQALAELDRIQGIVRIE